MRRVNLGDPTFSYDDGDPDGMRSGMLRLGPALGAKDTGTSLYELPPGEALCPYHYEYGEEEWLLVVAGRPSLRDPDGTHELGPWDVVFFPRGPDGAHQVRNDSDETVRVLLWSNVVLPTATVYPDSDKIGVWTGNRDDDVMVPRSAGVDYFHGEGG
ncbi:MAG: hypothetical protein QOJ35_847 [Solirubrobacteraceae bacterium]|jgi:uncharacterized cupin superfamily protein|nr:hypothetical protein [Solirubrobacteraceae bacterium]